MSAINRKALSVSSAISTGRVALPGIGVAAVVPTSANRVSVIVTAEAANPNVVYIHEPGGGATPSGVELSPGQSVQINSTLGIEMYNPAAVGNAVVFMDLGT